MTVRNYDPKTGVWRIYWVENTFSGGVIEPPVIGRFEGRPAAGGGLGREARVTELLGDLRSSPLSGRTTSVGR